VVFDGSSYGGSVEINDLALVLGLDKHSPHKRGSSVSRP
jgi:hypothetical protein